MELHGREARQRVLDVGFSSCTAPTFCHGPDISNISSKGKVWGQDSEFRVRSLRKGIGSEVWSAGVRMRLYLKSYRVEPDDF